MHLHICPISSLKHAAYSNSYGFNSMLRIKTATHLKLCLWNCLHDCGVKISPSPENMRCRLLKIYTPPSAQKKCWFSGEKVGGRTYALKPVQETWWQHLNHRVNGPRINSMTQPKRDSLILHFLLNVSEPAEKTKWHSRQHRCTPQCLLNKRVHSGRTKRVNLFCVACDY